MTSPAQTLVGRRRLPRSIAQKPRVLAEWLTARGEPVTAPLTAVRITSGRINMSWAIADSCGRQWILRERRPGTVRDFSREAAGLSAALSQGLPVPRLVGHNDTDAPFIVTTRVAGHTLHTEEDARGLTSTQRRQVGFTVVAALARIHRVDPATTGLPRFFTGYIDRQLSAMTDVWTLSGSDGLHDSSWRALRARLIDRRPRREGRLTLIHGDFRLANLVLQEESLTAIVDWDWCTAGHPLADLAWLLVNWPSSTETGAFPPSPVRAGGFPARGEIISAYGEMTNRALHDLPYYRALAQWRAAALLQAELGRQRAHGLDEKTPLLDVDAVDDTIADLLIGASNFLRSPR